MFHLRPGDVNKEFVLCDQKLFLFILNTRAMQRMAIVKKACRYNLETKGNVPRKLYTGRMWLLLEYCFTTAATAAK